MTQQQSTFHIERSNVSQNEHRQDEIKLIGYIIERIVDVRDKFIVNEVVALHDRLYVLHGETKGNFEEFAGYFSWEEPDDDLWFIVRGFTSDKRSGANVIFEYYDAFDTSPRYASRVIPEYHRAVARATSLSGGPSPLYDRSEA